MGNQHTNRCGESQERCTQENMCNASTPLSATHPKWRNKQAEQQQQKDLPTSSRRSPSTCSKMKQSDNDDDIARPPLSPSS